MIGAKVEPADEFVVRPLERGPETETALQGVRGDAAFQKAADRLSPTGPAVGDVPHDLGVVVEVQQVLVIGFDELAKD